METFNEPQSTITVPTNKSFTSNTIKELMAKHPRRTTYAMVAVGLVLSASILASVGTLFYQHFTANADTTTYSPASPTTVNVLVVNYDPIIESKNNQKLSQAMGWNNPNTLTSQLVQDFKNISHQTVDYKIVETIQRDEWPIHTNGRRYTDDLFLQETAARNWTLGPGDYKAIIADNQIVQKINAGKIDEVWLWGFPGAGWNESTMAGQGAYWINGGPVDGINTKPFVIMGYNYERGMSEALESYGHRTESIMRTVYGGWDSNESQAWNKFTLLDYQVPGRGGIGNAHNAFNAEQGTDYNRSSMRSLPTTADDWINFPNLTGATTYKDCTAWGCDGYGYLKWWYSHMPHVNGATDGLLNNWWRYIVDVGQFAINWKFSAEAEIDLAESNASNWTCAAQQATCTVVDNVEKVKRGSSSIAFNTNGAFDTQINYPAAANANWNLTDKQAFSFWVTATNPSPYGFQNNSPVVYLRNSLGGYFKYQPSQDQLNPSRSGWYKISIPLAGGNGWTRSISGSPSLADIDQIEIHADTWDSGFTLYFDNLGFVSNQNIDTTAPTVAIANTINGSTPTSPTTVNATDNFGISKVELLLNGQVVGSDSLAPYIIDWNAAGVTAGTHTLTAKAYDFYNNSATSAAVSVVKAPAPTPTPTATPSPTPTPVITQLLKNTGFESGAVDWKATTGIISSSTSIPPRTGKWKAWLGSKNGVTNYAYQDVTIPANATSANLSFYLWVLSDEPLTKANDKLSVQIRSTSNVVKATLATYSNLNKGATYAQKSFNLLSYKGQTVRIYFTSTTNGSRVTSFLVDDTSLLVK